MTAAPAELTWEEFSAQRFEPSHAATSMRLGVCSWCANTLSKRISPAAYVADISEDIPLCVEHAARCREYASSGGKWSARSDGSLVGLRGMRTYEGVPS